MLRSLLIRNFVLVDFLELDFQAGFGALTGETGAGKSILIDALSFVLGDRADTGVIRFGEDRLEVSAEFDAKNAEAWLLQNDLLAGDDIIVRRVLDRQGRSRAYINGSLSTLAQVKALSSYLLDIHGQHAHQSLLQANEQRKLLDTHAKLLPQVAEVSERWKAWKAKEKTLQEALAGREFLEKERDRLAWEMEEITALHFSKESWEEKNTAHQRLAHATALAEGAQFALTALCEAEPSCQSLLNAAHTRLSDLAAYDAALLEVTNALASAGAELSEATRSLSRYADHLEFDSDALRTVEKEIDAVFSVAKKLKITPDALPETLARNKTRLLELGEMADVAALQIKVTEAQVGYQTAAKALSEARKLAARKLSDEITCQMQLLALSGGKLEIALIAQPEGGAFGEETIEFQLSGVAGGLAKPLAKVASGGELSRISLAISVVTSQAMSVPTLIFDEVDVGIGGSVAEVVGRLLRELSTKRQVLCVTHLPQVAAQASWQWKVLKEKEGDRAKSALVVLDADARIEEIARMLGGLTITDLTREHAKEMLHP